MAVWKASRGFGGKSYLLALLGLTEALTLKVDVKILGGSGAQSKNVQDYISDEFYTKPNAPKHLWADVPRATISRFRWGNSIQSLMASSTSVRGPHPVRLRLDEIDEMSLAIFDAAMGQPLALVEDGQIIVPAQTVASSTHQYPNKTMTTVLRRANEKGWPVHEWCVSGDSCIMGVEQDYLMKDIQSGDKIYAYEEGQLIKTEVAQFWFSGVQQTLRIVTTRGTVVCTKEHRIRTFGGWKPAGKLRRDDLVRSVQAPSLGVAVVQRIEPGPVIPVYDLQAKRGHSFVANGVIVHNSHAETSAEGGWLLREQIEVKRRDVSTRMWCFHPEQKIISASGAPIAIQQIEGSVLTAGGETHKIIRKYKRDISSDESLLSIRVKGIGVPLKVTVNHQILTREGWKIAGSLEKKDVLISPKRKLVPGGDYPSGWLVGLYLSEGTARKDRGNRIGFSLHINEGPLVKQRIDAWIAEHLYTHSDPGFSPGNAMVRSKKGKACVVTISHKLLRELIEKWVDVQLLAPEKMLWQLPDKRDFCAGIIDGWLFGDGCETKQGRTGVTFSEDLAWQMLQIGTDLGFATGVSYCKATGKSFSDNDFYHVRINRFRRGWYRDQHVIDAAVRRYKEGEPTRKIAKELHVGRGNIKKWATQPSPRQGRNQILDLNDRVGRQIVKIEAADYSGELFDLTVDTNHTYLAGGVVVSNSIEYDLQEPSLEGRAIITEFVDAMFDPALGSFPGGIGQYIEIEEPVAGARYVTGADWAKEMDYTVIVTWRVDKRPYKLVAFERRQREPWPRMVGRYDSRVLRYPGKAHHDGTGIGNVIDDYKTSRGTGIVMVGARRKALFSNYIAAIEDGAFIAPDIEWMRNEHRYVESNDLYGSGHPPDSIVAASLAYDATTQSGGSVKTLEERRAELRSSIQLSYFGEKSFVLPIGAAKHNIYPGWSRRIDREIGEAIAAQFPEHFKLSSR